MQVTSFLQLRELLLSNFASFRGKFYLASAVDALGISAKEKKKS